MLSLIVIETNKKDKKNMKRMKASNKHLMCARFEKCVCEKVSWKWNWVTINKKFHTELTNYEKKIVNESAKRKKNSRYKNRRNELNQNEEETKRDIQARISAQHILRERERRFWTKNSQSKIYTWWNNESRISIVNIGWEVRKIVSWARIHGAPINCLRVCVWIISLRNSLCTHKTSVNCIKVNWDSF